MPAISAAIVTGLVVAAIVAIVTGTWSSRSHRDFVGGCEPFNLHAQNEFDPVGTLIWEKPLPTAKNYRGFSPNQLITVDGWVRTRSPYPTNSTPWDSDVWFHLANNGGWVSFAGVRALPTSPGPKGNFDTGSSPAPIDTRCAGTFRT